MTGAHALDEEVGVNSELVWRKTSAGSQTSILCPHCVDFFNLDQNEGMVCFVSQDILTNEPVGYCYGALVSKDRANFPTEKIYNKGMMSVSGREFRRIAM